MKEKLNEYFIKYTFSNDGYSVFKNFIIIKSKTAGEAVELVRKQVESKGHEAFYVEYIEKFEN